MKFNNRTVKQYFPFRILRTSRMKIEMMAHKRMKKQWLIAFIMAMVSFSFAQPELPSWTATGSDTDIGCIKAGVAFSGAINAVSNTAVTYSLANGSTLPAGLSLNSTTGAITGTATTAGSYSFTIRATNNIGFSDYAFSGGVVGDWISVNVGIIKQGVDYNGKVTAAGNDVLYAVSGDALPSGLTLNTVTGEITGKAESPGYYRFAISATVCNTSITKRFVRSVYPNFNLDLYTWGSNSIGQLGDGTTTSRIYPNRITIPANERWVMTAHGKQHSLAITEDGKLFAWGSNQTGQLGDGTNTTLTIPTRICLAGNCNNPQPVWVWISAGNNFSLGLTLDGKLYTWGSDQSGALGDGGSTNTNSNIPVEIPAPAGDSWANAACGYDNVTAITLAGRMFSWGNQSSGRLGNNQTTNTVPVNTPVEIASTLNKVWVKVAAGEAFILAVTEDNELYVWGEGSSGQLGTGNTTDLAVPTFLKSGFKDVSAGYAHSVVIRTDGKLESFGANSNGQLGDGTTVSKNTAVSVAGAGSTKSFASLFSGNYSDHSLAVTEDGELYAFGKNSSGIIGDSTTVRRITPVQVAPSIYWFRTANYSQISSGLGIEVISLDKYWFKLVAGGSPSAETRVATVSSALPDRTVVWTSSDESVATVDQNGNVTAVGGGTAIITATVMGRYSRTAQVVVTELPSWTKTGSDTDVGCWVFRG